MKQTFLFLFLLLLPIAANAEDSGKCGESVFYSYDKETQSLNIFGEGPMWSYDVFDNFATVPWPNSVQKVNIEPGVTSIGSGAFINCHDLISLTIPNSITIIDDYAFKLCTSLSSLILPDNINEIGFQAFYGCSALISVLSLNNNSPLAYSQSFEGVDKNKCLLLIPEGSMTAYKKSSTWSLFNNIKEDISGDVNLDGEVNKTDLSTLTTYIMGKAVENINEYMADINKDHKINAVDVVKLIDNISLRQTDIKPFFSVEWVPYLEGADVVALSCKLNNDSKNDIQLIKCEFYADLELYSYLSFSTTNGKLKAGSSKKVSFDNLKGKGKEYGFTVAWQYILDGEGYMYRCKYKP